ncbi:hypothetical protein Trihar35433_5640 [Trichoderma harzianum]|nr:hypothetical protein Trihar35433_5640 [Trichoderma harzianum]
MSTTVPFRPAARRITVQSAYGHWIRHQQPLERRFYLPKRSLDWELLELMSGSMQKSGFPSFALGLLMAVFMIWVTGFAPFLKTAAFAMDILL